MSPLETANAVRQMLSAANLPIDLEQAALLERTLKVQANLDSESAKLAKAEKVGFAKRLHSGNAVFVSRLSFRIL